MKRILISVVLLWSAVFGKFIISSYYGYHQLTRSVTLQEPIERVLFNTPAGVAIIKFSESDRAIFIVDESWHRIVYSRDGANWIKAWGEYGGGSTGLRCPLGCAADENQNIYVADFGNNRVVKLYFNAGENELQYRDGFLLPTQGFPWDVTYWAGAIYVTDYTNHSILKYDTTGNLLKVYGGYGSGIGQFYQPQGIAVIRDTVYVADMGNLRVVALRDTGNSYLWLRTRYLTELERPWLQDVEVDNDGGVYVVEHLTGEIFKFAPGLTELLDRYDGSYVGKFSWPRFMEIRDTDAIIAEEWSDSTGIRYYNVRPGVVRVSLTSDVLDLTERDLTIWFMLDGTAEVSVAVYKGDTLVKQLCQDTIMGYGAHQILWDGKDETGKMAKPGNYRIVFATVSQTGTDIAEKSFTIKGTLKSGTLNQNEHWTEEGEPYVLTARQRDKETEFALAY
ncbi:MAG: hypothetical protein ACPL28_11060 [bacterium]